MAGWKVWVVSDIALYPSIAEFIGPADSEAPRCISKLPRAKSLTPYGIAGELSLIMQGGSHNLLELGQP